MVEKNCMYTYQWVNETKNDDKSFIRIYGISENGDNICVRVRGFKRYVYVELPSKSAEFTIAQMASFKGAVSTKIKMMHHLYHLNKEKKFPFLKCRFTTLYQLSSFTSSFRHPIVIPGVGRVKINVHEDHATPVLQLISTRNLKMAGWLNFTGKLLSRNDQITNCQREYIVDYKNLHDNIDNTLAVQPKVLSFDLEVNSENVNCMPSNKPGDRIFQISCVFNDGRNILLTLPKCTQIENVTVVTYSKEKDLLVGFIDLLQKERPNVLTGYNILSFDIPYLMKRCLRYFLLEDLKLAGFNTEVVAKSKEVHWASSAFKNQHFEFIDWEGIIVMDLLPIVRRDYRLDNYKLNTVAVKFVEAEKDPLSPKDIFSAYRNGEVTEVGKYCVKDSDIVMKLFNHLQIWVAFSEMAKVCNVGMFTLYTQGQQIKIYSQVYKYCFDKKIIVDSNGYVSTSDEKYRGAFVLEPEPGYYEDVVPFDFSSLYPTLMQAWNICFSSAVIDESVPDELCHIFEWEDHQGCIADDTPVTMGNRSENIRDMYQCNDNYVYSMEEDGAILQKQSAFFNQGKKECVSLTFQDGRILTCTPDHRILTEKDGWVEAAKIGIGRNVQMTYNPPIYHIPDAYVLNFAGRNYAGGDVIKLMQLFGMLCSDGTKGGSWIYVDHKQDMHSVIRDIKHLSGEDAVIRKDAHGWTIRILGKFGKAFRRTKAGCRSFPSLLFEEKCPNGVITSFLSGLFGVDGHTPYVDAGRPFTSVRLSWTKPTTRRLNDVFEQLQFLLQKLSFHPNISRNRSRNRTKPVMVLTIPSREILQFHSMINFAHCKNKALKLEVVCTYFRYRQSVLIQQRRIVEKVKQMWESSGKLGIRKLLESAAAEEKFFFNFFKLPLKEMYALLQKNWHKITFREGRFPTPAQYMESIGARHFFPDTCHERSCPIGDDDHLLPTFSIPLLHREKCGLRHTYDIEVSPGHSFIANGIIVHNCEHDPKVIKQNIVKQKINKIVETQKCMRKKRDSIKLVDILPEVKRRINTMDLQKYLDRDIKLLARKYCNEVKHGIQKNIIKLNSDIELAIEEIDHDKLKYLIKKQNSLKESCITVTLDKERALDEIKSQKIGTPAFLKEIAKAVVAEKKGYYTQKITDLQKEAKTLRHAREDVGKSKLDKPMCAHRRYRFYKADVQKGVIPTIITNLLQMRKFVKGRMKETTDPIEKIVYDKQQLAYKVSANSMYGGMGVQQGLLAYMPGAMCVTMKGREALEKARNLLTNDHKAVLIYQDTDSCYVRFPWITTPTELWDHCVEIENAIIPHFPHPMKLAFEEIIYRKFLILSKKRYMWQSCTRDGILNENVGSKGVLLARRDNSKFIRNVYEHMTEMIFLRKPKEDVYEWITKKLNALFECRIPLDDYVITKSVGDSSGEYDDETCTVGSYKVRTLSHDPVQKATQLNGKDERAYYISSMPAHVQLAERMRLRGFPVDVGTRLEYVVLNRSGARIQGEKIEELEYYKERKHILKIDKKYYLETLQKPIDQLCGAGLDEPTFMAKQEIYRLNHQKVISQLKNMFMPKIAIKRLKQ